MTFEKFDEEQEIKNEADRCFAKIVSTIMESSTKFRSIRRNRFNQRIATRLAQTLGDAISDSYRLDTRKRRKVQRRIEATVHRLKADIIERKEEFE